MKPLQLDQVTRAYSPGWGRKPVTVLHGITLSIDPGECFGYLGTNGAGKTTTMKILVGLIRPTSGEASLFGVPVNQPKARIRVGFVSEEPSLPIRFTPLEVLEYAGRLSGTSTSLCRRRGGELLERLGIGHRAHVPLRKLSKGQRQRTALAHALIADPDLLLLDEPLSGLDALGRREVIDLLTELHRAGKTIFLSSHVLADVERLCDRVGIVRDGRLAAIGTPRDIAVRQGLENSRFEDVFLRIVAPDRYGPSSRGRSDNTPEAESGELLGV